MISADNSGFADKNLEGALTVIRIQRKYVSGSRARKLLSAIATTLLVSWASVTFAAGIPTVAVRHLFDITGQSAGGFLLPTDVAVSNEGRIYIVDGGNNRVVAFDRNGKHLLTIGRKGSGEGQFKNPVGVGIDGKGRVYVADTGNHRIQVFNADGRFQYAFPVAEKGEAIRPIDVAADASGAKIYVSGNNNHKMMSFAAQGTPIRQWGGNGEGTGMFRYPASVVLDGAGDIYVADALNSRVQGFNEEGALLIQVGSWGVLPGQLFRPKGVALDGKKRIYISDSYMDVIQVYDNEGRFLHVLGQDGKPQRFISAGGIAIGNDNRLYTAEILRNKVSVYSLSD
jgi:DNA-binding beta-propeller fold protein YncE